ncbi:hypothetical protein Kpho02_72590 [Kitasatospora phosalacinea]|uniref:Uncharacterized protein n=1 Tax=Kitasatospora phosalacinea TaxID=2065 RepID=A0A9W6QDU5_9ACTN|nr:hypothetical protein [Kitasatospora phosalacinea]GLW74962.1 hypothetical protein Kpho02_72590 [Kitasatospora phosalacinea]
MSTAHPDRRPARAWAWLRRNASAVTALATVAGVALPAAERLLLR